MSHQDAILAMWFYSSKCSPRRALPPNTLNFSFSQNITKVVSVQLNFCAETKEPRSSLFSLTWALHYIRPEPPLRNHFSLWKVGELTFCLSLSLSKVVPLPSFYLTKRRLAPPQLACSKTKSRVRPGIMLAFMIRTSLSYRVLCRTRLHSKGGMTDGAADLLWIRKRCWRFHVPCTY